jgi:hypothetical protein
MWIADSFFRLRNYCESQGYKGWDPYDGLNSAVFQVTPFKHWDLARLVWIQLFKRSPINLRPLLLVPKQHNAKGIGLFLSGYCNLYRLAENGDTRFGRPGQLRSKIDEVAQLLLSLQSRGYSGACWGYGFDWQSRAFFLPRNTPTVVATSFAVEALISAYEITRNSQYLDAAVSSARFVVEDLNRIEKPDGLFMFSYSPLDRQAVYNATLLGTKILSQIYVYTGDEQLKSLACASAKAVCALQNPDGSFPHSDQVGQDWRDNFHTGFKLESLAACQNLCQTSEFKFNIDKGFDYWINAYFDHETGFAYYYDRGQSRHLLDLHCAAQALPTIYKLGRLNSVGPLFDKVAQWPVDNMLSLDGYFYFQGSGGRINKTPYMRWPNAWMFYGLSYWLLSKVNHAQD